MDSSSTVSHRPIVVIVVSYNTRDLLERCIASVVEQLHEGDEFVVVDNDSADGSAEMIEEKFPSVRVIRSGGNLGFGKGCNLGATEFPEHDVLMFNPDAVAHDGMIDALHQAQQELPEAGVIGGRSVNEDGDTDPRSCWGAPSPWSAFSFATGLMTAFRGTKVFDPEAIPGWDRTTQREVDAVSGALMLVKRPLWDQLGGFDERYFMYGEDLDLCRRAWALGARPTLYPSAMMRHEAGGSSTGAGKRHLLMKGKITAGLEHHPGLPGKFMRRCYITGVGLRAVLSSALRKDNSWTGSWPERADWQDGYPPLVD